MRMDFFGQQDRARQQTRLLIGLFSLAVLVVTALIYLVLASLVWVFQHPLVAEAWWNPMTFLITACVTFGQALIQPLQFVALIWNPQQAGWIALATVVSIALGCVYQIRRLSAGGAAVAELLGGRLVQENPRNEEERRLRTVVEEMAIASGMPVPKIYVLDRERGINTFAAGHNREDVAIGVTYGCLKLLTRDELQGVVAHEFSHVLNGDTRLNMDLMGLAHGLFWPTIIGRVLLYGSPRPLSPQETLFDHPADPGQLRVLFAPLAFVFLLIGSLSSPLVRLIKSMICREREWLADAAAVQFTRNPTGIEGALKKIGGLAKQGRLDSPQAEIASHLYLVNCVHDPWLKCQATHPSLLKRVLAIDPGFDGKFQRIFSLPSREGAFDGIYDASVQRARAETNLGWENEP